MRVRSIHVPVLPAALAVLAALALSACGQPRDPDWYAANPEKAQARLQECEKRALAGKLDVFGDSREAVDCRNTAQGLSRNAMRAFGF